MKIVLYSVAGNGIIGVNPTRVGGFLSLSNKPLTAANDGMFGLSKDEYYRRFLLVKYRLVHHVIYSLFAVNINSSSSGVSAVLKSAEICPQPCK